MWHLENFSDEKLLDIVENYALYKYEKSVKFEAEAILKKRGVELKSKKEKITSTNEVSAHPADQYLSQYKYRSIITFALFIALIFVQFIVNSYATLAIFGILVLLYIILLFSSHYSHRNFYRALNREKDKTPLLLFVIIGFVFFPVYSIYLGNKMGKALPN